MSVPLYTKVSFPSFHTLEESLQRNKTLRQLQSLHRIEPSLIVRLRLEIIHGCASTASCALESQDPHALLLWSAARFTSSLDLFETRDYAARNFYLFTQAKSSQIKITWKDVDRDKTLCNLLVQGGNSVLFPSESMRPRLCHRSVTDELCKKMSLSVLEHY